MPESDKILSQHEVDALLSAIDSGGGGDSPSELAAAEPYDFRRPSRIPPGPLRFIHGLHEGFARALQPALSGVLLKPVEARLTGVHQLPLREFASSLPQPAVLVLLSAEPLEGGFLLSLNPAIAAAMVERMLGAGKIAAAPRERGLSPLEWNVADTLISRLLDALAAAWAPVAPVKFVVLGRESDPQTIRVDAVDEPAVVVTLEVALGDQRGSMDLMFPASAVEPHFAKMVPATPFSPRKSAEGRGEDLTKSLAPAEVDIGVHLPAGLIRMGDLQDLKPGDFLVTSLPATGSVQVSVEGRVKFLARLGSLKERKAAKILEAATEEEGGAPGELTLLRSGEPASTAASRNNVLQLPVTATVVLAEKSVRLQDVLSLKAGDVMEFAQAADGPLSVRVAGRTVAEGSAVRIGERFGVKVTSLKAGRA